MAVLGALAGLALIFLMLADGFEVIMLPRRVSSPYRLTRVYYPGIWWLWWTVAGRLRPGKRRETFLAWFGPLSVLVLFLLWVSGLIVGFGLLHWGLGIPLRTPEGQADLATYLYLSGVTFFTLGYGEVIPDGGLGRFLAVAEAGLGFGFLALIISYLPVLYQAFSRREATISLLDARAGSPPSAAQVLLRLTRARDAAPTRGLLREWEGWAAELLESHLSFPMLSYYRSQHDNQSWLATLTVILDTSALLLAWVPEADLYQVEMTFAAARHAAVDLAMIFRAGALVRVSDRLPADRLLRLREELQGAGLVLRGGEAADAKLAELRGLYEPFLEALSRYFLFTLPPFQPEKGAADNWQRSPWIRRAPGIGQLAGGAGDESPVPN